MSIVDKEFAPLSTILEKLTDESKLYQPPDRFYNDDSNQSIDKNHFQSLAFLPLFLSVVGLMLTSNPLSAVAENLSFDPALFQPVCHFSDVVYQFFKAAVGFLIGSNNLTEYGPIIASLLLRLRLELCVIESYYFEAVVPFINQRGLSWVLPLHETVETFLTGSIFAVATNLILLTSTKVMSFFVLAIDVFTGMPARFIGGLLNKPPSPSIFSTVLKVYGNIIGSARQAFEAFDSFVGKYLGFLTVLYIGFKFIHYKFEFF